jgi:hypothetical protein
MFAKLAPSTQGSLRMKIEAAWSKPIPLKKDSSGELIYQLDLDELPDEAGVYVFGRKYGDGYAPIYIGETLSIRRRIKDHLKSVPLMKAIENAPNGGRFLIFCTVSAGTKEKAKKHVGIIEKALILHAQAEGHELFNQKGTKLPTDTITFTGNRTSECIAPRVMLIKRALSRRSGGAA